VKTTILETLVLPALKSVHIRHYPFRKETIIVFEYTTSQHTIYWKVIDYPKQQLLAIESSCLATVPSGASSVLERLNEINELCVGKFMLVDQNRIEYCLELPYTAETPQAVVQHALNLAFDTVETQYEGWQKAVKESQLDKDMFDRIKAAFG
jgi:hypothetical protein